MNAKFAGLNRLVLLLWTISGVYWIGVDGYELGSAEHGPVEDLLGDLHGTVSG